MMAYRTQVQRRFGQKSFRGLNVPVLPLNNYFLRGKDIIILLLSGNKTAIRRVPKKPRCRRFEKKL